LQNEENLPAIFLFIRKYLQAKVFPFGGGQILIKIVPASLGGLVNIAIVNNVNAFFYAVQMFYLYP